MKYSTIMLLHGLLESHVDDLDETCSDSKRLYEEAIDAFEAESGTGWWNPGDPGADVLEKAQKRMNLAKADYEKARDALDDLKAHDWH